MIGEYQPPTPSPRVRWVERMREMLLTANGVTIQTHWIVYSEFFEGELQITYMTNGTATAQVKIIGKDAKALHKLLVEEAERDVANSRANSYNWQLTVKKSQIELDKLDEMLGAMKKVNKAMAEKLEDEEQQP